MEVGRFREGIFTHEERAQGLKRKELVAFSDNTDTINHLARVRQICHHQILSARRSRASYNV